MQADIKAQVEQIPPSQLTDGQRDYLRQSVLGQLFTADWHQRLVLAGYAYTVDFGTVAASTYTALTGNAAPDLDQPEIVIAADSGFLVPMEIDIAIAVDDMDAYDDVTDIVFIADRSQAEAAAATATVEVPNNLLDGGAAFSGRCYSIVTGNITAPVPSDVLATWHWELTQVATEVGGVAPAIKKAYKTFAIPTLLAGPCQIIGYVTGTNTPTFTGSVKFANVPAGFFPTS